MILFANELSYTATMPFSAHNRLNNWTNWPLANDPMIGAMTRQNKTP